METKIMLIALDYDGTYTADPELWDQFISNARARGHEVIIATMRIKGFEEYDVNRQLEGKVDKIIYTDRRAKKAEVIRQYKNPDIWIDDMPEWLFEDAITGMDDHE